MGPTGESTARWPDPVSPAVDSLAPILRLAEGLGVPDECGMFVVYWDPGPPVDVEVGEDVTWIVFVPPVAEAPPGV